MGAGLVGFGLGSGINVHTAATTASPPRRMLRLLSMEKAPQRSLFQSDFYTPFLYLSPHSFPNHGRLEILQPLPKSQPPGDAAPPAPGGLRPICPNLLLIQQSSSNPCSGSKRRIRPPREEQFPYVFFGTNPCSERGGKQAHPEPGSPIPSWGCFPPTAADAKTPCSPPKYPKKLHRAHPSANLALFLGALRLFEELTHFPATSSHAHGKQLC